jgi:CheY-like chemotaxis protein/HPt (histidine-containing phosphotransfer) domain-containing protein
VEAAVAKVLVVDDEDVTRSLLESRLRGAGHRVAAASSADEARDVMRRAGAPSVLVSDMFMPGGSGLQLVSGLRADPEHADLPVIFLSGRALPADIAAGQALGAQYLLKPFSTTALTGAIDVALGATPDALEDMVRARLADLGDLDSEEERELFARLLSSFVEQAPDLGAAVEAAMGGLDAPDLLAAAHRLRGSAANLGAGPLAALCEEWEDVAEQGGIPEDVEAATAALRGELAVTCRVFSALARELVAGEDAEIYD